MKFNNIMPECYMDSTLVSSLLDAKVNHKCNCSEVAKEMEKGRFKDAFAVGIIDNDKRQSTYTKNFDEIGTTQNLTFLKHRDKHQYLIKVGQSHKAMETFIIANIEAMGMTMENFGLPSELDALIKITKNSITTQKDPRIVKLCKELRKSPEAGKLKNVLDYLASNQYNANIEVLKKLISK